MTLGASCGWALGEARAGSRGDGDTGMAWWAALCILEIEPASRWV